MCRTGANQDHDRQPVGYRIVINVGLNKIESSVCNWCTNEVGASNKSRIKHTLYGNLFCLMNSYQWRTQ